MCGIFGYIPSDNYVRHDMHALAMNMCASLKHRGPDDQGYALWGHKGALAATERQPLQAGQASSLLLGQTRLSIIDLSAAGHQPMSTPDGQFTIVFNGEIYNYKELRLELQELGATFHTQTDTEVLLQAFVIWGQQCLTKLVGMFAFAIYDSQARRLFMARDFFGIKPFFWSIHEGGFCFASEIPALLHIPGISKKVDWQQSFTFLRTGIVEIGPQTLIAGIHRLMPGHWMQADLLTGRITAPRQYWKVPLGEVQRISKADAADNLRTLFLDSVALHLRSDVPVGIALSGGLDSSCVLGAARHLMPDAPLHSFSFIAEDPKLSEEYWVDLANTSQGAIAHKICPSADDMVPDLDHMTLHQGEPVGTTSIYAQYCVMRMTSQSGVKVLLEGQGADELFGGYVWYLRLRVHTLLANGETERAIKYIENLAQWPGRDDFVRAILVEVGASDPLPGKAVPDFFNLPALAAAGLRICGAAPCRTYKSTDKLREALATSLTWDCVPGLMRHGDRNAMAFSIENRVPFCTPAMASFALSLPEEYLISDSGESKSILRAAMRGILPDELLDRRDKIGFEAPGLAWFKTLMPWVIGNFFDAGESALIDHDKLLRGWKSVLRGEMEFNWQYWNLISYLRWKKLLGLTE